MKKTLFRSLIALITCISLLTPILPQTVRAESDISITVTISGEYADVPKANNGNGTKSFKNVYRYESASTIEKLIEICKKYSDMNTITGIRNQIDWMNELYRVAVQDFIGHLGLGETLLLAVLNHTDINTALMGSSYSTGDINREVAKKIAEGSEGYVNIDAIAKATGLSTKDVQGILNRIASGGITEKTIAIGKNRTRASSRGVYVNHQAIKQDKVWTYLVAEVDRMTKDPESLAILYNDLGSGYVDNMLSGQELDKYKVSLYKNHLAKTLDAVLENENPISISTLTKNDVYKVTEKAHSALSKLHEYEMALAENSVIESMSEEMGNFLKKAQSGGLTESEAMEYLVLSGQYAQDEYGIEEAAKLLSDSYSYLKDFEVAMENAGNVFSAIEEAQKVQEFIDYLIYDHSEHIALLESLEKTLADSGADMDLMAAAKDLKRDYEKNTR